MDKLGVIYSNTTLHQQTTPCSCSTHLRWDSLVASAPPLPFALNQAP
jgi:hypothetical protein